MGRKTIFKFDEHTSGWFMTDNSIWKGDLLCIILYLYYNSRLLALTKGQREAMLRDMWMM